MDDATRIQRWRLILGQESQERFTGMGGAPLTGELALMDQALAAIYTRSDAGGFGSPGRGAGTAPPIPSSPDGWEMCAHSSIRTWSPSSRGTP